MVCSVESLKAAPRVNITLCAISFLWRQLDNLNTFLKETQKRVQLLHTKVLSFWQNKKSSAKIYTWLRCPHNLNSVERRTPSRDTKQLHNNLPEVLAPPEIAESESVIGIDIRNAHRRVQSVVCAFDFFSPWSACTSMIQYLLHFQWVVCVPHTKHGNEGDSLKLRHTSC